MKKKPNFMTLLVKTPVPVEIWSYVMNQRNPVKWMKKAVQAQYDYDIEHGPSTTTEVRVRLKMKKGEFANLISTTTLTLARWEDGNTPAPVEYFMKQIKDVLEEFPDEHIPNLIIYKPDNMPLFTLGLNEDLLGIGKQTMKKWSGRGLPPYIWSLANLLLLLRDQAPD